MSKAHSASITRLLLLAGLAPLLFPGASLAQTDPKYEFDTDSGQVTLNQVPVFFFEGSQIIARPVSAGVRTWLIRGDMIVPPTYKIVFTGDNLAQVLVGGHFFAPPGTSISASATDKDGGPGGGDGGKVALVAAVDRVASALERTVSAHPSSAATVPPAQVRKAGSALCSPARAATQATATKPSGNPEVPDKSPDSASTGSMAMQVPSVIQAARASTTPGLVHRAEPLAQAASAQ